MSLKLVFSSSVLKNGKTSGTELQTISFMPSTQLLAHLITINSSRVMKLTVNKPPHRTAQQVPWMMCCVYHAV